MQSPGRGAGKVLGAAPARPSRQGVPGGALKPKSRCGPGKVLAALLAQSGEAIQEKSRAQSSGAGQLIVLP
jgi:hypothetical protein